MPKKQPRSNEDRSSDRKAVGISPPEHTNDIIGTLRPQDLTLGPVIGHGAFSTVFSATYKGEKVALKRQTIDAHILRELAILKQIDHPNLLRYIGSCEWDHQGTKEVWIVSEFVQGGDVRKYLKGKKSMKLTWKQTVQVALDAAEGIRYLHEKRIIHRDIKAANMLLDENLRIRLCDFGFAREVAEENNSRPEVSSHSSHELFKRERRMSLCGTDAYMSPEMFFEEDYNESADIFSYGIVLMELICRRQANEDGFLMREPSKNFVVDMEQFRANVPRSCPLSLVLLAENCTSFEASGRPSAREIVEWLEDLKKDLHDDDQQSSDEGFSEMSMALTASIHEEDEETHDVAVGLQEEESHFDEESAPIYYGALHMPHGYMRRWRQRWVVIRDSTLSIYKSQKEYQATTEGNNGRVKPPVSTALAGCVIKQKKNRRWMVVHADRQLKLEFQAANLQDMQLWIAMLDRAIKIADYLETRRDVEATPQVVADPTDEIYKWLDSLGLARHYQTFKDKGFATIDFVRETGLGEDDFNFLGIENNKERDVLAHAALVLRGEV
ncbi:hypothetical protein LEN26_007723 [Aphanomyces euteiches]|nr:hypothetical protein AeMF1_004609 [Aphanomyces euteiches]KAH9131393.1 hypothetical protein LEN26_007723 [Aphanomyces euteiches]